MSVFGHDLDRELEAAKACIGIVPQEINFNQFETPQTILVNQAGFYGIERPLARERTEKYLSLLQLADKRNKIARGLSGGMKRRLMIARALVHEPRLLILDEPTAGVDIEIRRSMWDFLREINARGTTIILTTHYLEEAETLVPQHRHHQWRADRRARSHVDAAAQAAGGDFRAQPARGGHAPCRRCRATNSTSSTSTRSRSRSPRSRASTRCSPSLTAQGIGVLSMRNKVNRLEELFMKLVERKPAPRRARHERRCRANGRRGFGAGRCARRAGSASRPSSSASTAASSASGRRPSCPRRSPRRCTSSSSVV